MYAIASHGFAHLHQIRSKTHWIRDSIRLHIYTNTHTQTKTHMCIYI